METKAALKTIRQYIDAKNFKEAGKIIEDLLKQDVSDYLLFVFAAITNGEIGNNCEAINYYKKAAELDSEKPLAWQGLYKLYEQEKYVDLEQVLIVIQNLLRLPGITPEKMCMYERELNFILLKLKRFDEVFSNLDRLNDVEFCCEALKMIVSIDDLNGGQKKLLEKCLTKIDTDKLDDKIHQKCAVLRSCLAETLEEIRNVLSYHAKYISLDDEWLTNLLRYIEKVEISPSIKNIDENLRGDTCKWPYIGLAIPLLLLQERYEQVLSLLDTVIPHIHPAITKNLNEAIFGAKCEALYGIHDDDALAQLNLLLTDNSDNKRVPRDIRLAVMI
ncbi:SKI3 subunit of superkiller complex protein [Dirofilaria immitis]